MATQAGALEKTHFYAMALATHNIFPPPTSVGGSYGEERVVNFVPLRLAVSEEIPEIPCQSPRPSDMWQQRKSCPCRFEGGSTGEALLACCCPLSRCLEPSIFISVSFHGCLLDLGGGIL